MLDKLIDHLRYGTPYHGDVQRDTLDALERLEEAEARYAELRESVNEVRGCFPEEDFLGEALSTLREIDPVMWEETVADAVTLLEQIQAEVAGQVEYARELLS